MTDGVFVIENSGIKCKGCGGIHKFITGLSDKGCTVPLGFSQEKAQEVAKGYGLPESNVVLSPDTLVMLDDSARKLPRPSGVQRITLAQEVVRSA